MGKFRGLRLFDSGHSGPIRWATYKTQLAIRHSQIREGLQREKDTERLYTEAIERIVGQYNAVYTWEIKVKCMGMKGHEGAQYIIDSLHLPISVEEYYSKVSIEYDKLFPTAKLLPDTVDLYNQIHSKVLKTYGHEISWQELMKLMGHTCIETCEEICQMFNIPAQPEQYKKEVESLYSSVLPSSMLMKGAEKLVRHLYKYEIPIAIASGSSEESYNLKTTNHKEFVSLFNPVVLASSDPEVKNGKPNPDVFLVCAKRFKGSVDPKECLVFEDAPNGVLAGVRAGMQVVMVPDSRMDPSLTKDATLVLNSLEDFKPEQFGLPPYEQ
ncbi:pseudouridine-5'-phosphatase-like isoform X1 [Oratosquilla oratoria]|uniref:pseudouridine-5'-phosphatase-like isoform X1 n=1 Tax=Oratosquilla oratoria TaxID=337810 RepID=UPI003F764BAD